MSIVDLASAHDYRSPVAHPDAENLIAALAELGEAVVVLQAGRVVTATGKAATLPDLAGLAERAEAAPILVTIEGRAIEASTKSAGDRTVLLLRDVEDREEARRALARSDEILSLGSHELKGPLHVIGMICHLLDNRSTRGEPLDRGT